MSRTLNSAFLAVIAAALTAAPASAQFFTDPFDDLSSWTVAGQPDTTAAIIDYSALGIPEAPNMVAGAATTGVQFTANSDSTPGAAAVNLIGAVSGGNADLTLAEYQVDFDMWLSVGNPIPSGGTEQGLWGVGRTTGTALGRNNRAADGDGVWGWIATENGYGTEDAAAFSGTLEQADLGDTQAGEAGPFNAAFAPTALATINNSPGLQWVEVTIGVKNGQVGVYFNGVPFFLGVAGNTAGDVMVGYEDPFSSISGDPANQYGIIDNVRIDDLVTVVVPEPTSVALVGLGLVGLVTRRKRS